MVDFKTLIQRNPTKRFGKPCVRETRITVYDVLGWRSAGMTFLIDDFPELTINERTLSHKTESD